MKAFEETSRSPLSSSSRPVDKKYMTSILPLTSHKDDHTFVSMTSGKAMYPTHSPDRDLYEGSIDANLSSAEHLNRSMRSTRRKCVARKNLMGSIYTKHNDVQRSYSFVAGERPSVEVRFPKVYYSDNDPKRTKIQTPCVQASVSRSSRRSGDVSSSSAGIINRSPTSTSSNKVSAPRTKSHKLSLPEIIMEFNMEANHGADPRLAHVTTPTDDDEDEREFAAPYEAFLNRPKNNVNNPCRSKYRPVTPGLLESLNKLRVPSKIRTEQWVKSSQTTQKSYCGKTYRTCHLDNANLAFPNWIYTDT